ncbi:DUF2603 domain-containing protein [Helicobacter himalayensis]|uniref:DUF2603 domain-containing protein n=1 Tax=Helicobacter himalayensis TaxID=1591088 RepID=UPI00083582BA|nr:DUF2603 domain-containing protein [Helicobacter himalayensis]
MKIAKKTATLFDENIHQQYSFGVLNKIDSKNALIALQKGELKNENIWLLRDNEDNEFALIPSQVLNTLNQRMRDLQEERFFIRLEREIAQQMPIDMDDVVVIASEYIESFRKKDGSLPLLNARAIARDLKKQYPNLFFNLQDLLDKR